MRLKLLCATGPRETDLVQAVFFNLGPIFLGHHGAVAVDVFLNELGELGLLALVQFAIRNACVFKCFRFGQGGSEDISRSFVGNHGFFGLFSTKRVAQFARGDFLYLKSNKLATGAEGGHCGVAGQK